MCEPFHFTGISPEVFQSISGELASKGFNLSGPEGIVNGPFGIVIKYYWDEPQQSLTIEVMEKSFFVTCGQIRSQLTTALEKYVS